MSDEELLALLIDFEECERLGRPMDPERAARLQIEVKDILGESIWRHADEIPAWNPNTGHVSWKPRARRAGSEDGRLYENAFDDPELIDALLTTLDRLLRLGRRNPRTKLPTPSRIAKQVRDGGERTRSDPRALIADCVKYAIFDELRTAVRRVKTGATRRIARAPRVRKQDARSLVRHRHAARLAPFARKNGLEEPLAYCVAFEYHRGGIDRARVAAFETLPLGNGPLSAVLDGVDAAMKQEDDAQARTAPASTRRRPARARGIVAPKMAEVLRQAGLDLSPGSLSSLYNRRSQPFNEVLA